MSPVIGSYTCCPDCGSTVVINSTSEGRNAETITTLRHTVGMLTELLRDAHKRADSERARADSLFNRLEKIADDYQRAMVSLSLIASQGSKAE
jgi:uncharacterized Zn finger protein (UPF0148 family)